MEEHLRPHGNEAAVAGRADRRAGHEEKEVVQAGGIVRFETHARGGTRKSICFVLTSTSSIGTTVAFEKHKPSRVLSKLPD